MAIPLSIVSRHFTVSYEKISAQQQVKKKALNSFATTHRKSSAFVIAKTAESVTRRLSQLSRRVSVSVGADSAANSNAATNAPAAADLDSNSNSLALPKNAPDTSTNSDITEKPSIISNQLKIELQNDKLNRKEVADAKKLVYDYQVTIHFLPQPYLFFSYSQQSYLLLCY